MSEVLSLAQKKVDERTRAKTDKFFLANEVLGFDFQWETHAELFACFVKYNENLPWVEQDATKDRMVLWSRGHYKTTAVIVEIIQAILNFPNIRILIMQGSLQVTKTLLKQVLAHFTGEAEGSRLGELFPEFCGKKKELLATTTQFTTTARTRKQLAQATVTCASPKSVKTGQHYEVGFFDDLVNDQNFRNIRLIAQVRDDFTLAQALIDPGGYRFVSGTRYAFGDLYEEIQRWQNKDGRWVITLKSCWTDESVAKPDAEKVPRFPRFKKRNGESGGFTREELLQMQSDDPANFACQYLNQPLHSTQQAFTEEMLDAAVVDPANVSLLSSAIMIMDLASSEAVKADDSVIVIGKVDALGVGYMCDMRGDQWPPMELALNAIEMVLRHRPVKVLFEKTASCVYFADFLRIVARQRGVFIPIDFIKVDNRPDAKNMRVVSWAGLIKRGRFKFFAGLSKFNRLIEQAIEFPKGRHGHDDYPDTGALLAQELNKEILTLPTRPAPRNAILALIADRENALMKVLTQQEQAEVDYPNQTGLD